MLEIAEGDVAHAAHGLLSGAAGRVLADDLEALRLGLCAHRDNHDAAGGQLVDQGLRDGWGCGADVYGGEGSLGTGGKWS